MNNSEFIEKIHPPINDFGGKLHAIGCDLSNPCLREIFYEILKIKRLKAPIVCLPDLYLKARTEAPASIASAVKDTIVPTLSAPSLGCSMGIIATDLTKNDLTPERIKKFIASMQDELGKWYGFWENVFTWLGLKTRPLKKFDLTKDDFEKIIREGAKAAVKRYNFSESTLENIEMGGSVYETDELINLNLKKILPRSSFTNGRHDLGYGFKGNHFLEVHVVEAIFDIETASKLGLKEDQVVLFYHGGGGIVPYHIGRYYANRRKNNFKQKFFLTIGKIFFHLFSIEGIKNINSRLRYYFFPGTFQEIDAHSPEGKRYLLAIKAALNYSYAFNIAILARVRDALKKTYHEKDPSPRLVWALAHNSIFKEKLEGEDYFIHRHTLNRIQVGKPAILSGFNNTVSYLGMGLNAPEKTLWSAEHGAGENIKRFKKENKSREIVDKETVILRTKKPFETHVAHQSDEGVDYVMSELEKAGLMRRVLSIRPVASFKG